jgi:hypothetical protein
MMTCESRKINRAWNKFAFFVAFFGFVSAASSADADPGSVSQFPVEAVTPEEDEADNWIFGAGLYSNDPKTGKRVNQYAKEQPSYRNTPSRYSNAYSTEPLSAPRYYGGDPFFADNRDTFFQDTPNPFFADINPMTPFSPIYSSEGFGSNTDFYGVGSDALPDLGKPGE